MPDLITMAKGLTSAYVQLGAVGMRQNDRRALPRPPVSGGLTYNSHPAGVRGGAGDDCRLRGRRSDRQGAARTGKLMADAARRSCRASPIVSVRFARSDSSGLSNSCAIKETREPMAPFNSTSPEMAALGHFFRHEGLYTFVRWNYFFTNPPLSITEAELREGFAIIDRGSAITDKAVT